MKRIHKILPDLMVHSHLRFIRCELLGCTGLNCTVQTCDFLNFLHGLKSSTMGYVIIFLRLCGLKSSRNSSRLLNHMCEWTITERSVTTKNWLVLTDVCIQHQCESIGECFIQMWKNSLHAKSLPNNDITTYWKNTEKYNAVRTVKCETKTKYQFKNI